MNSSVVVLFWCITYITPSCLNFEQYEGGFSVFNDTAKTQKINDVHAPLDLYVDWEHAIAVQVQLCESLISHQRSTLKPLDMNWLIYD